jgi:hypothetical protein
MLRADKKIERIIGELVQLGDLPSQRTSWSKSCGLPRVLCVNVQLPHEAGSLSWGGHPASDHGCSVVAFFHIKEETLKLLQQGDRAPPYVRLFQKFVEEGRTDLPGGYKASGLLKAIADCENLTSVIDRVPKILQPTVLKYNAKPTLITKSGAVHQGLGGEFLELAIDVRRFCWMAKNALQSLRGYLPSVSVHIGFLIQGFKDEELPEGLICDLHLHSTDILNDPAWITQIPDGMAHQGSKCSVQSLPDDIADTSETVATTEQPWAERSQTMYSTHSE